MPEGPGFGEGGDGFFAFFDPLGDGVELLDDGPFLAEGDAPTFGNADFFNPFNPTPTVNFPFPCMFEKNLVSRFIS